MDQDRTWVVVTDNESDDVLALALLIRGLLSCAKDLPSRLLIDACFGDAPFRKRLIAALCEIIDPRLVPTVVCGSDEIRKPYHFEGIEILSNDVARESTGKLVPEFISLLPQFLSRAPDHSVDLILIANPYDIYKALLPASTSPLFAKFRQVWFMGGHFRNRPACNLRCHPESCSWLFAQCSAHRTPLYFISTHVIADIFHGNFNPAAFPAECARIFSEQTLATPLGRYVSLSCINMDKDLLARCPEVCAQMKIDQYAGKQFGVADPVTAYVYLAMETELWHGDDTRIRMQPVCVQYDTTRGGGRFEFTPCAEAESSFRLVTRWSKAHFAQCVAEAVCGPIANFAAVTAVSDLAAAVAESADAVAVSTSETALSTPATAVIASETTVKSLVSLESLADDL
eukprot:TRINITY_DN3935_c0_g1_i1.p1 TRINITY_DN3935_c0_g1~~TRINITY_DN3935_c0_g1_i1.p1  ORF type:complete len:415 (-),score=70.49 TRINITY_DN3935_c0_g1_i1:561-1760(-)